MYKEKTPYRTPEAEALFISAERDTLLGLSQTGLIGVNNDNLTKTMGEWDEDLED
jgi:hypothetical protein